MLSWPLHRAWIDSWRMACSLFSKTCVKVKYVLLTNWHFYSGTHLMPPSTSVSHRSGTSALHGCVWEVFLGCRLPAPTPLDLPLSSDPWSPLPNTTNPEDEEELSHPPWVPKEGLNSVVTSSTKTYIYTLLLVQEPLLRATQYLPSLVQLQKQMYDFCHRRLDRKDVAKLSFRKFISSLKSG